MCINYKWDKNEAKLNKKHDEQWGKNSKGATSSKDEKKKKGENSKPYSKSKSTSSRKPKGDDPDEGATGAAAHFYMIEVESDSYDGDESELDWDSEGNVPAKKALCAECEEEGDYWVMCECHRCVQVFHPPCVTPDGNEVVVMDDRYDSYVCPSCEVLYVREGSKRQKMNERDNPAQRRRVRKHDLLLYM
jgi:hypothetical protein